MRWRSMLAMSLVAFPWSTFGEEIAPVVELEEVVYSYTDANNGAGPLWDHGSSNLVRIGDEIFASGLDTLQGVPPLNNTQCRLWRRDAHGWQSFSLPDSGHSREPCPLVAFPGRHELFLSANPTINPPGTPGRGPANPTLLRFSSDDTPISSTLLYPLWREKILPPFTEHSYRSFSADGGQGQLILFQNIGNDYAEWSFRNESGVWSAQGQLAWPRGSDYPERTVRVAYPNVLLSNRAVHFAGVTDIVEPEDSWRTYKRELTGKTWDYVFRQLFYTWTPDVTKQGFANWIELANREKTAGRITLGDLWVSLDGNVHVVWEESVLDMRLRNHFFPQEKQRWELNYAVLNDGKVVSQKTLVAVDESETAPIPHLPRFHVTPSGRLFVFFYVNGTNQSGEKISENRIIEIEQEGGGVGPVIRVPLNKPLSMYMTATSRAGTAPSKFIDLLGTESGDPSTIRYVRVRIE